MPPKTTTKDFKYIGDRAVILEGGRPVEPGEYVSLTDEEASTGVNATAIADGVLIDATGSAPGAQAQTTEQTDTPPKEDSK